MAFLLQQVYLQVTSYTDGTVSKWYDQSGNDNHATQGTPASQPKIVSGGALGSSVGLILMGRMMGLPLVAQF